MIYEYTSYFFDAKGKCLRDYSKALSMIGDVNLRSLNRIWQVVGFSDAPPSNLNTEAGGRSTLSSLVRFFLPDPKTHKTRERNR